MNLCTRGSDRPHQEHTMSDFFGNLGKATNNLFQAIGKESGRIVNEAGRHMTESIDEVAKQTQKGGLFMGAATAADKLSPGNFIAGAVDSVIPGEDLPQPLVDGISAAGNLVAAGLVGGPFGAVFGVMAVVDGFQAIAGTGAGSAAADVKASGGQRMQTPESPSEASARRGFEVRIPAELLRRGVVVDTIRGGGWADGGLEDVGIGGRAEDPARAGRDRLRKMEADARKVDAEIEKILRNPNLSFEDMVFLLMRALIKQSNLEVKAELQAEKNSRTSARAAESTERKALQAEEQSISRERAQLMAQPAGAERDGKLAKLAEKQTALASRRENFSSGLNEASESRQERFEQLKEAMQKISEMEQALSNIMNSLHQTAMNAIGNIR
jgi:hypothetical protein